MSHKTIRIALASLKHPKTVTHGLEKIDTALRDAADQGAAIVCFPETYIPGLRGEKNVLLPPPDSAVQHQALQTVRSLARAHEIAVIIGMEWPTKRGLFNRAYVIDSNGRVLGYQTKNQITPGGESRHYSPDGNRRIFSLGGMKFGIVICHEGWRYPETVRWAACRGAQIVFQPQVTGDQKGKRPATWGKSFYEKAMICRAQENTIYFASVNTAMAFQNSATSLIAPDGRCIAHVPCGRERLLIHDIDLSKATRLYAKRYNLKRYPA